MRLRRSLLPLLTVPFWSLFGVVTGIQIWTSMIEHNHSLPRIVGYQVLVWNGWALLGWPLAWFVRRLPLLPLRVSRAAAHLGGAAVAGFLHALWCVGLVLAVRPYDRMNPTAFGPQLATVIRAYLPFELIVYLLVALAVQAGEIYQRSREHERQAAQLERSLAEARLHALELQIQPHFLFNTLNAVSALVRTGRNAEATTMIGGLSDLLRYALERGGEQRVPLDDEIAVLRRYLEIQALRFPDRLRFDIELAPGVGRAAVPVLLLQPLAENAVRHGIAASEAPGEIRVHAWRRDGALEIELFNTGTLPERVDTGIGLANTRARLEQLYGADQRFALEPRDGGVVAHVTLPWREAP